MTQRRHTLWQVRRWIIPRWRCCHDVQGWQCLAYDVRFVDVFARTVVHSSARGEHALE